MTDDLVKRLRDGCYLPTEDQCANIDTTMRQAADEIEHLTRDNRELHMQAISDGAENQMLMERVVALREALRLTAITAAQLGATDIDFDAANYAFADTAAAAEAVRRKWINEGMERAMRVCRDREPEHSLKQKRAYESGDDRSGEWHHAKHVEAFDCAAAIRAAMEVPHAD